jgi:hypothetical protein
LRNLNRLSIFVEGNNSIDLSCLTNLEHLAIKWRRGKINGLEKCAKLKSLCLVEFEENDLVPISLNVNLQHLQIKTSSIQTLDGICELDLLESILLGNCRALKLVKSLNGKKLLRSLEFEVCSKMADLNQLNELPNLEYLRMTDCGKVESIRFVRNFTLLERLEILGNTNIVDGDLSPSAGIADKFIRPRKLYKN